MLHRIAVHVASLPLALAVTTTLVVATGGARSPLLSALVGVGLLSAAGTRVRLAAGIVATSAVRFGIAVLGGGDLLPAVLDVSVLAIAATALFAITGTAATARRQLRRRESEMVGLYEEHHAPSLLLDPNGVVLSVNRAVVDLTGLDQAALVGRDLGHVVDAGNHAHDIERIRRARTGVPQLYDSRIRTRNGSWRDIRVALHPLVEDGDVVGLSVVGHDVTVELDAHAELARSEERYRSISEHARVGIYDVAWTCGVGRFTYVNPALSEMCGIPAQSWYDDIHVARHHVPLEDQRRLGIDAGQRTHLLEAPARYRWRRPDGEIRWHEATEVPIRDAKGGLVGIQGIIHDVTDAVEERDLLADALARQQQAVLDLKRLDAMKNTFLQSVSHELRTPLTGIVGMSATLRERGDQLADDARGVMLDAVHRNACKLQRLLADLLDVDRLARGIIAPRLGPTDLAALVRAVIEEVDLDGRHTLVELRPTPLVADAPKVERIIENLVVNAARHTPEGATVRIATAVDGTHARLVVEDDGPGIPEEHRASLFEPFFQGPASSVSSNPGTGIGLTLVARLTELHGGRVHVTDSPSGGARFVVELPGAGAVPEVPVA